MTLGIHIADVAAHIACGSTLFEWAHARAGSAYHGGISAGYGAPAGEGVCVCVCIYIHIYIYIYIYMYIYIYLYLYLCLYLSISIYISISISISISIYMCIHYIYIQLYASYMHTTCPPGERTWRYWSFERTSHGAAAIYNIKITHTHTNTNVSTHRKAP